MTATASKSRKVFVNLAVADLNRSKEFFGKLGFELNPKFTDDDPQLRGLRHAAPRAAFCFTKREICDTATHTEALVAISFDSRAEVDEMVRKAIESGGSHAMDAMDHGFMYGWSFYDPDGHHWEVLWMDPAAAA